MMMIAFQVPRLPALLLCSQGQSGNWLLCCYRNDPGWVFLLLPGGAAKEDPAKTQKFSGRRPQERKPAALNAGRPTPTGRREES